MIWTELAWLKKYSPNNMESSSRGLHRSSRLADRLILVDWSLKSLKFILDSSKSGHNIRFTAEFLTAVIHIILVYCKIIVSSLDQVASYYIRCFLSCDELFAQLQC